MGESCREGFQFPEPLPPPIYSHTAVRLLAFTSGLRAGILENEILPDEQRQQGAGVVIHMSFPGTDPTTSFLQTENTGPHKNLYVSVHSGTIWVNKLRYIHTMDYYSAIEMSDVLRHGTTWTLKTLCSGKEARHKKATYCMIPLTSHVQNRDRLINGK